jgi:EamA domain-containing membrane protein RarD
VSALPHPVEILSHRIVWSAVFVATAFGILQYRAPVMQFSLSVFAIREPAPPARPAVEPVR